MERCLKKETGKCEGCLALETCKRIITMGVPYQEAVAHTTITECPVGFTPDVGIEVNQSGQLTKVMIEGQEVRL